MLSSPPFDFFFFFFFFSPLSLSSAVVFMVVSPAVMLSSPPFDFFFFFFEGVASPFCPSSDTSITWESSASFFFFFFFGSLSPASSVVVSRPFVAPDFRFIFFSFFFKALTAISLAHCPQPLQWWCLGHLLLLTFASFSFPFSSKP